MSDDNKEGAGVPVAWEVRNAEISYHAVFATEREARGVADQHDEEGYSQAAVRALYATPPAVMPAAPSDAVLRGIYYSAHDALGLAEWTKRARAALTQPTTMQQAPGVHALSEVVRLLREQGHYEDEEGDATNQLADLLDALKGMQPGERKDGA